MSLDKLLPVNLIREDMVVFAGAGLSMAAPTSLPGWYRLNELVFDCLCDRYEQYLNKPDYLVPIRKLIDTSRQHGHFPPDYQAQLLHEHCGDDYFRLLQSVDVSVTNANHEALAQLAATGRLKAIVTTNFDRLIETALTAHGVAFNVAYDAGTYESCFQRMSDPTSPFVIDVIKIHGCVQDHLSLVDTLKQRLKGRNRFLENCLAQLLKQHYFVYAGFSAQDLESDPDYLGLRKAAARSPGFLYVQWPGEPELSRGAATLMSAYGNKSRTITADSDIVFRSMLGDDVGWIESPASNRSNGEALVAQSLAQTSQSLSTALVSTCVAAVLEANGQTRGAYDILHTFWRGALSPQRAEPGFVRFRLLHGRLGVGLGQIAIGSQVTSSRLEDSVQNLLRVGEQDRRANAWAGLAMVWWGRIDPGYQYLLSSLAQSQELADPPEHRLDCWFALAEYRLFSGEGVDAFEGWSEVLALADSSADMARMARVAAMVYVHLCDAMNNVANAGQMYQQVLLPHVFSRSDRLNDPISEGLIALARARWFNHQFDAINASAEIDVAMQKLSQAGMVRWYEFARIELSKTLMDQGRLDEAVRLLKSLEGSLTDHALLQPRFYAAVAALHTMTDNSEAAVSAYREAAAVCQQLDMHHWRQVYEKAADEALELSV